MAEPQTVNLGIIVPNTGDLVGTWGSAAVNPDFVALDGLLGGIQTVSAGGSSPITLSSPAGFTATPSPGPTQAQNAVIRFTGVLTGNVTVTLPLPGAFIIENLTTGAFVLTLAALGAGQVIAIQQGTARTIYSDGSNVRFVNLPDVGTYVDVAATVIPPWITACTVPPFLNCDGTTFSAATYPFLNAFLGGNTLPDLRGVARYTLNQGTGRITSAVSGLDGNTLLANKFGQSTTLITANLPPYTPAGAIANGAITASLNTNPIIISGVGGSGVGGGGAFGPAANVGINVSQVASGFNGTAQGGTSTPISAVGPGTIAGITLIRAA